MKAHPLQKNPKNKRRKKGLPRLDYIKSRPNQAAKTPQLQRNEIRLQPGPQYEFGATRADIAIYGGAAGGGKTFAALVEPLRHLANGIFEAVIFRRTRPQIKQAGGLLVESTKLYPQFGGKVNLSDLAWTFPSGMRIRFAQLQHEKSKLEWQGAQVPLVIFDELTHFSEGQFFYLVSRMRSNSGVPGYIRATCNPDPDSWVAEFISWWIDQESGLPIPDRSGRIRYFVRDGDTIVWGDSHKELREKYPHWSDAQFKPKSVTFIAATVYDNKALLESDPDYLSNLMALPLVEREQLLGGNWKIKAAAGLIFKQHWFGEPVPVVPAGCVTVAGWDFASTEKSKTNNDPDWTCRVKVSYHRQTRIFYVEHVYRDRLSELGLQRAVINMAAQDGQSVMISIPRDPGQAGKFQTHTFISQLARYDVRASEEEGHKTQRAKYASAQSEAGNVKLVKGPWNREFLAELAQFPDGAHDDQVDAFTRAFNILVAMFLS